MSTFAAAALGILFTFATAAALVAIVNAFNKKGAHVDDECKCGHTDVCEWCTDFGDHEKPGKPYKVSWVVNALVLMLAPFIWLEQKIGGSK